MGSTKNSFDLKKYQLPPIIPPEPTPIEKNIPGVTIIGQFVQQIFANEFLQRPDWLFGAEFIAGLVLSLLITFMIQALGPIGGLTVLGVK